MPGMNPSDDPDLHLGVESELPREVEVGRGNVLLVHGWCFHARRPIRRLELQVRRSVAGPARPGHAEAGRRRRPGPSADPLGNSERSGFMALLTLGEIARAAARPRSCSSSSWGAAPRLEDGRAAAAAAGRAAVLGPPRGRRSAGRDLHGDLRPSAGAVPAPDRVDSRADPRQLGLPDQRRRLFARGPRDDRRHGRRRPPLPGRARAPAARRLSQLRAGARRRSGRRRRWSPSPTRTTAGSPTSWRSSPSGSSAARRSPTATPASRPRPARRSRRPSGPSAPTTPTTSPPCFWSTR